MSRFNSFFVAVLCVAFLSEASNAADRFVAQAGQEPLYPYISWETAASNIQHAVDAAEVGETVWISDSVYLLDNTVTVSNNITLRGFGAGATLDGQDTVRCLDLGTTAATVADLTITRGYTAESGGGILMQNAIITNCVISNCEAEEDGGGLWVSATGTGQLLDSHILNNRAQLDGGGVRGRALRLERNLLRGNIGGNGGGSYLSGNQDVIACDFIGNSATNNGGGLLMSTQIQVMDSLFQSNSAALNGGGVHSIGVASATGRQGIVAGSRIFHNTAGNVAGGISLNAYFISTNCEVAYNVCSNLVNIDGGAGVQVGTGAKIYNSLVHHNVGTNTYPGAARYGTGGIYGGFSALIENCLVYANRGRGISRSPGGISLMYSGTIRSTTVAGNLSGGGIYFRNFDGTVRVENSIIFDNAGMEIVTGKPVSITYSCFPAGSLPEIAEPLSDNNIELDPLFVNAEEFDFRLRGSSPCINAGSNQTWMAGAFDLAGNRRLDNLTKQVDLGCYEFEASGVLLLLR